MELKSRLGQVTIFVIIAVVIVAAIVLLVLLLGNREPKTNIGSETNPSVFFDSCAREEILNTIDEIGIRGGYFEPENYIDFTFSDSGMQQRVSYLCYSSSAAHCVNQEPLLLQHLKEEIKDNIEKDVRGCFSQLSQNYDDEGYTVEARYKDFDISLKENFVEINLDAELALTKNSESTKEGEISIKIPSGIYGLGVLAQEIVSKEAENCEFDYVNYMLIDSAYRIKKEITYDNSEIYFLEDKKTKEEFDFAVRGCLE